MNASDGSVAPLMHRTLLDKIWDAHTVADGLLWIDLHLVIDISSAQAFEGLRIARRGVRRPDRTIAVADHNVQTDGTWLPSQIKDELGRELVETLERNCEEFGVPFCPWRSQRHGIAHVMAPDLGLVQPGMTIVCTDSHTSTHGAFGALGFGIGTSEAEHVLATQCLVARKPKSMRIRYAGRRGFGVTAKDMILDTIRRIGVEGARGYVVEFAGSPIRELSMEGRMTMCNMTIEAGGRAGLIAPDETTFAWLHDHGVKRDPSWSALRTDDDAGFDAERCFDLSDLSPMVSWGTTPAQVVPVTGAVPPPSTEADKRALEYMGLAPGMAMQEIGVDRVFIGSCTNARLEDLRAAAAMIRGRSVAGGASAMVVPGSAAVKRRAEAEGLDQVFRAAGFDWRSAGCSMCLGMNPDTLEPGERCASTSNRNFEGRQGRGGRTHIMSPEMAAAAAIAGHFVDIRDWG